MLRILPNGNRTWQWDADIEWSAGDAAQNIVPTSSTGPLALPAGARAPDWAPALLRSHGANDWETRALLAIGEHESGWHMITQFGGGPARGYFQIEPENYRWLGTTGHELLSSPGANVRAGLKMLRAIVVREGQDFPALVATWASGGVRESPIGPWYVAVNRPTMLSEFVAFWNANPPPWPTKPMPNPKAGAGESSAPCS